MNTRMYEHSVTRENIAKLKKLGYGFVGPARGELACREMGLGHIAETQEILAEVRRRTRGKKKR
jgi:phosphopantothenoylcysteine decarboxylase/phosphopantothenate--cysteine ligase